MKNYEKEVEKMENNGIEIKRDCFAWIPKYNICNAITGDVFLSEGCGKCNFYQPMNEYIEKQIKVYGFVSEHYRRKAIDMGLI